MRGIALRFGTDDVDVGDLGSALDMNSFSLTFYETKSKRMIYRSFIRHEFYKFKFNK